MSSAYESRTRKSKLLFKRAQKVFAGGVNHNTRFFQPYPIFVTKARRQHIWDEDGNRYTDYWMGHLALILGHSPKVVTDALAGQFERGTQFGMGSKLSVELGEEIQGAVPCAEALRFCNTGAEATMYLVRLARGFTGKRIVVKMAGGWHGYNTELHKGVHSPFDGPESSGILAEDQKYVRNVRFNDLGAAEAAVKSARGEVAAIFLEPILGAGGCIPADKDYLEGLRELADRSGALLAFDEIITGFRLGLGGAQGLYGVKPDLATFGKIAGGGLPLGLVAGRREILSLADPRRKKRLVSIGGGTFSENPLTMTAGLATLKYLRRHAATLYSALGEYGRMARQGIDKIFAEDGIEVHTTGLGSLFQTHFGSEPRRPEDSSSEEVAKARGYALFMISRGVFMLPAHLSAISRSHRLSDVRKLVELSGRFGDSIRHRRK